MLNQPYKNRGDESAHKGLLRSLCHDIPDVHINVVDIYGTQKDVDYFNVNLPNVTYTILSGYRGHERALLLSKVGISPSMILAKSNPIISKAIKEADLVLCAPGGINMGGFHSWYHIEVLMIAKYYRKPIAYFGRSIGPFDVKCKEHTIFNKWSSALLHYFGYISLRDQISLSYAHAWNINNVIPITDAAFLENPRVNIPYEIEASISGHKYVVFVPNELTWHYQFKDVPVEHIERFYHKILDTILEDQSVFVVMLPQTVNSRICDHDYFKRLIKKYGGDTSRILILDELYGSDIQQTIISKSEYVVGARYHSIVFAINNNRPFVSLSYEHKMKGLLETCSALDYMVEITNVFNDIKLVDTAVTRIRSIVELIKNGSTNDKYQKQAKEIAKAGYNKLLEFISTVNG